MRGRMMALASTVKSDPAVDAVMAFNGGGFGRALNTGNMFITLKPLNERGISADRIVGRLRGKLAQFPGVNLYLQPVQDLRVGGRRANAQYQYTLQSDNVQDLLVWAPRMLQKLRTLPGLLDVNSDQQDKGLQAGLVIDRATASRLGVSAQAIDNTLYDAFGQRQVSTMYTSLNQYHVVLEVAPQYWQNPDGLKNIYVAALGGFQVPLSTLTHYQPSTVPLVITHQGQFPSVTLSFNLAPGLALGDAVSSVEIAGNEIGLPSSIHGSFQGTAQAFQSSLANEPLLIAAALITVYIVLGVLYESMIHPVTILSTLPSAGVGALLALLLCRTDLSVIALIGIILLIGIVKKNAIMMIDFALEAERSEGKNPADAIFQACLLRFRPIMMTTMAALLGGLPLALGGGVGSELRRPLGIAIVGGLVFSQMLTLYTTPVTYLYMERCRLYFSRLRQAKRQPLAAESV
jgi:multidrug efflux pump